MKILIDSNIVIYSPQPENESLKKWLKGKTLYASAISQLEVLGYHKIKEDEVLFTKRYFSNCEIISIEQNIIEKAIELRQAKSMSLGDAIIAATATLYSLSLLTANGKDFKHIEKLNLINPLAL